MKQREYGRRHYRNYREAELKRHQEYRRSHREQVLAYEREWRQRNHEKFCDYRRKLRSRDPNWVPMEIIQLQAREYSEIVIMLRREGRTWREIADLTGRGRDACRNAYKRGMERIERPLDLGVRKRHPTQAQREQHDALVLSTYHNGMTWDELARLLGYASGSGARYAYNAALDRATRPEQREDDIA